MKRSIPLVAVVLLVSIGVGIGADRPVIPAVQVSEAPVIDADLSDPCWKLAPSTTDFYYLTDGSRASEPTTAWICYDQKNIYVAFHCIDSHPELVSAQQTKRGGSISSDDWAGIEIDCNNNQTQLASLDVSAGGIQKEILPSGDVSKIEWRGDWQAAGKKTADGFNVEIAIPWKILRYNPKQTSMGICFRRNHPRVDAIWHSPNTGIQDDARLNYVWDGLKLPRFEAPPLILAYGLLSAGDDAPPSTVGVDIKKWISPTLVANGTINPDFHTIEQDATSVDFTYAERKLGDKRPFFQEGSSFMPGTDVFYSRRIGEMNYGAKVTGKIGDCDLGFLHGTSPDEKQFQALRFGHAWNSWTELTLSMANSRFAGDNDLFWMVSGHGIVQQHGERYIDSRLTVSATDDSASGKGIGHRLYCKLEGDNGPRSISWEIQHEVVDAAYRPRLAYVPEWDFRAYRLDLSIYDNKPTGRLSGWEAGFEADLVNHMDGSLYYKGLGLSGEISYRSGTGVQMAAEVTERPPFHDRTLSAVYWWGGLTLYKGGYAYLTAGSKAGGDYLDCLLSQGWKLGPTMSVQATYQYTELKPPSPFAYQANQLVATVSYDLSPEQNLSGRAILVGGGSNYYLCYRRMARRGTDIFLILGDPNAPETRNLVTLKLVKAF